MPDETGWTRIAGGGMTSLDGGRAEPITGLWVAPPCEFSWDAWERSREAHGCPPPHDRSPVSTEGDLRAFWHPCLSCGGAHWCCPGIEAQGRGRDGMECARQLEVALAAAGQTPAFRTWPPLALRETTG